MKRLLFMLNAMTGFMWHGAQAKDVVVTLYGKHDDGQHPSYSSIKISLEKPRHYFCSNKKLSRLFLFSCFFFNLNQERPTKLVCKTIRGESVC
jgi:hypothetical protein